MGPRLRGDDWGVGDVLDDAEVAPFAEVRDAFEEGGGHRRAFGSVVRYDRNRWSASPQLVTGVKKPSQERPKRFRSRLVRGEDHEHAMDYRERITIEPGKRGGKPCVRGMRITVYDVLGYLASGMTYEEVLEDFPYLEREDILACLAFAAERERKTRAAA